MKNIKHGSLKFSSIEKKLNKIVIYLSLIVLTLCIICTIFGAFWRNANIPNYELNHPNAEYVLYYNPNKDSDVSNDTLEIIRIFASYFIMFNTLIPISLMITYQIIKALQILLIENDPLLSEGEDKIKALTIPYMKTLEWLSIF